MKYDIVSKTYSAEFEFCTICSASEVIPTILCNTEITDIVPSILAKSYQLADVLILAKQQM